MARRGCEQASTEYTLNEGWDVNVHVEGAPSQRVASGRQYYSLELRR